MMKYERGYSCEFIANICGVEVTTLSWKDKQILSPNIVDNEPPTVKRFDKKEKV